MSNIAKYNQIKDELAFPEGKIILLDGRILDCYPAARVKEMNGVDDGLKIDTTGEYLSLKKKSKGMNLLKPKHESPNYKEVQKDMFLRSAFYLFAHKERILSDSRMFLCPIHIQSGLAYMGTSGFEKPTLGIYIEWWLNCAGALRIDKEGHRSLVYCLSGSPLSGSNSSAAVNEHGKTEAVRLSGFINYWPLFIDINSRYTKAKYNYQAYQLKQVLDILGQEDNGNFDYSRTIETEFLKHEIATLNESVAHLKKDRDYWFAKYRETLLKYNDGKIHQLYEEYEKMESMVNTEIEGLKIIKKALRAKLKSGKIDNKAYQQKLMPINKRIFQLESQLADFKRNKVKEMFPDEDISFNMIEEYIHKSQ